VRGVDIWLVVGARRWARIIATELCGLLPEPAVVRLQGNRNDAELMDWWRNSPFRGRIDIVDKAMSCGRNSTGVALVINPAYQHQAAIEACLAAGYNVVSEKPLAYSREDTVKLLREADRLGLRLFSTNTYLFAEYLRLLRRNWLQGRSVSEIRLNWADASREFRYGHVKGYDSSVPIIFDVLPHIATIVLATYGEFSLVRSWLRVEHGGSSVSARFECQGLVISAEISRNSHRRVRSASFATDQGYVSIDFSSEPGTVLVDGAKPVSADPEWDGKRKPVAEMLLSVKACFEGGSEDRRLAAIAALAGNHLIDSVVERYVAEQLYFLTAHSRLEIPDRFADFAYAAKEAHALAHRALPFLSEKSPLKPLAMFSLAEQTTRANNPPPGKSLSMNYTVVKRSSCRLCGSGNLAQILRFAAIPFFDEVVTRQTRGSEFSYPMELYFCRDCRSVQTQHDVNLREYYHSYQYVASHSPFIRKYMSALVDYCWERFKFRNADRVIDVGAADGYLLSLFRDKGAATLGFEAAHNLSQLAQEKGISVMNALFTKESLDLIPNDFRNTQLVVLLHTFDHLYDPAPFLDSVRQVLDPRRGVLVLEVHDLHDIYLKRETALFGHEHAIYLHYGSMSRFLQRHGFRMIDFNFLPKEMCRGSSMLVAATLDGSEILAKPGLDAFADPRLDELSTFGEFKDSVSRSFEAVRQYVEAERKKGRRLAGYGGWGRGVTTLAMAELGEKHLEFVVDGNANLHGCYTPVTGLRITGPEEVSRTTVDEVIVFNYGYLSEIKQTLSSFISAGGRVVSVLDLLNKQPANP
jgi:predicted dehydrogenase/SAM-dependent methyltransferase